MSNLTAKQRTFIDHYLMTLNGTEAARRAKYRGDENTLGVIAHENLRKPKIKAEIEQRLANITMSADEALARMTNIARGDLSRYVTPWGNLDVDQLKADGVGHILKKYKRNTRTTTDENGREHTSETVEIELYPADTAIERIMRFHGVYQDSTDHTGEITIRYVNDWRNGTE